MDSISVYIPLNVTADLGVAIRRCREKRLRKLRRLYPEMFPKEKQEETTEPAGNNDEKEDEPNGSKQLEKASSKKKGEKNIGNGKIPRREDFGSMLDYMEAKYASGVMVSDPDEKMRHKLEKKQRKRKREHTAGKGNDSSSASSSESSADGAGSTYSEDRDFIDDSVLRTEVAEQVMASSGFHKTKIEAQAKKEDKPNGIYGLYGDDDAFFVNVGDLEMEDGYDEAKNDPSKIDFDALAKSNTSTKKKKKKKPRSDAPTPTKSSSKPPNGVPQSSSHKKHKRAKSSKSEAADESQSLSSMSTSLHSSRKHSKSKHHVHQVSVSKQPIPTSLNAPPTDNANLKKMYDIAQSLKSEQERLHAIAINHVKNLTEDHLPRKTTETIKVSIKIPPNKNPGDDITFANPRVPGQRLRVKLPENATPGGKFCVSVPVPSTSIPPDNNFPRDCKDALDDYSRAYDDWIDAETRYRDGNPAIKNNKADPFKPNNEKMKKFDVMLKLFPSNLATPIDATYLRKVVRRARQNSMKRKTSSVRTKPSGMDTLNDTGNSSIAGSHPELEESTSFRPLLTSSHPEPSQAGGSALKQHTKQIHVPKKSVHFDKVTFDPAHFAH